MSTGDVDWDLSGLNFEPSLFKKRAADFAQALSQDKT